MLPPSCGEPVGSFVRKNKSGETNGALPAEEALRWETILRDILIPRLTEAKGDAFAAFDAETFRDLLSRADVFDPPGAPDASTPASEAAAQDDGPVANDPEIVATVFTGAAQPAVLTALQAIDWLQTRFGADIDHESAFGPPQLTVSESGAGTAIGSVSIDSLGADIAALAQNALVGFGDRAIIGADEGDLVGGMFLVIDSNGQAGFQYGEDEILVLFKGLPSTDLTVEVPLI